VPARFVAEHSLNDENQECIEEKQPEIIQIIHLDEIKRSRMFNSCQKR